MNVDGSFGPVVAVAAGTVSFLSPCVLPLVPVYAAQMAGATALNPQGSRRDAMLRSVAFVLGFSVVFIALGASIGLIGSFLREHQAALQKGGGVLLIVLGLHQTGILRIPLLYRGFGGSSRNPSGYAGWALVGAALSLSWLPCIGPTLALILERAASSATATRGAVLLGFYSLGLAIPFLLVGILADRATDTLRRARRLIPIVEVATGIILILFGILIFTDRLTDLNRFFEIFDIFGIGTNGGLSVFMV